jgi:hypothetical protein
MGLSDELRRALPPFRLVLPAKTGIVKAVERLRARWGEPGLHSYDEDSHVVERAAGKLTAAKGDLSRLSHKEKKAVVQILWQPALEWGPHREFVRRWLAWAEADWRPAVAVKRIWRHHLLRFDAESPTTRDAAAYLFGKSAILPERYRSFSEKWRLFEPDAAAPFIATSLMQSDEFIADVETIGIARGTVQSSALTASILESVGKRLLDGASINEPTTRLTALFGNRPDAMRRIEAPPALLRRARGRLADGLVRWAVRRSDGEAQSEVMTVLDAIMGDPRLSPAAWDGVAPETIEQVEAWLSKKTLEVFFHIIDHLRSDAPHQWPYRKRFWERYLTPRGGKSRISRAWLLCGRDARLIAERANVRYGTIAGTGIQADHCALMMQIGGMTVIEMNKNASALFFTPGNPDTPRFYETRRPYDRNALMHGCSERLGHHGSEGGRWQAKFAEYIEEYTGIRG